MLRSTLPTENLLRDFGAAGVADLPANRARRAALMASLPGRLDAGCVDVPETRGIAAVQARFAAATAGVLLLIAVLVVWGRG